MDPDEMRALWAEHERKIEANLRLNRKALIAIQMNRARGALQRLILGLALEAVIDFAAIVALGSFSYAQRDAAKFALPASALDAYMIAIFNAVLRQIAMAFQIDYDGPVAAVQRQIEELRILRLRSTQWILLLAPLAWTPLLIVALKGLWGVDAYKMFGPAFLLANLLFGLAIIPLALGLARRFGDDWGRSLLLRRLVQDITGRSLREAGDFVATVAEFETENGDGEQAD
jgi:hypothetical protein